MTTSTPNVGLRRRWFQFRLRTLFVLMTIAAVWIGFTMHRIRERHRAIETIRSWGGRLEYVGMTGRDARTAEGARQYALARDPQFAPGRPAWLRYMLGEYGKYVSVNVDSIQLRSLMTVPDGAHFDLSALAPLREVTRLELGIPVDDAALLRLPDLPNLEHLGIFSSASVSDKGLQRLDRAPNLRTLRLSDAKLSIIGYRYIGRCANLEQISLTKCTLTDDGLEILAELKRLRFLGLGRSIISDAAVPHISKLGGLKSLEVSYTQITEKGVKQLQAALPDCEIRSSFKTD